jgi:hypothetical protein
MRMMRVISVLPGEIGDQLQQPRVETIYVRDGLIDVADVVTRHASVAGGAQHRQVARMVQPPDAPVNEMSALQPAPFADLQFAAEARRFVGIHSEDPRPLLRPVAGHLRRRRHPTSRSYR